MVAVIGLLVILLISLSVVRIGSIAFELTGLSADVASFQAQSAFSGVGFTTSESETIVSHPVRRRIAKILIILGSAGITSTIATMIVAFISLNSTNFLFIGGILAGGLMIIYLLARSKMVYNVMKKIIVKALNQSKQLKIYDYQEILGISKGYSISTMVVKSDNWLIGKQLKDLELNKEGTLMLSIHRNVADKEIFLIPSGETKFLKGDRLTLYGRNEACHCLSERPIGKAGNDAHNMRCDLDEKLKELEAVGFEQK